MNAQITGRTGLAQILEVSESMTRVLQAKGLIKPIAVIGKRPVFSVREALEFKASRMANRGLSHAAGF
jgi:hypothetical protein